MRLERLLKEEFGLKKYPFVLHPVSETFVETTNYRRGLLSAQAGLFVLITGEVGAGKTTMLLRIYRELSKSGGKRVVLVQKPYLMEGEAFTLLYGRRLFGKPSFGKLVRRYRHGGVILVDEAQTITPEALSLIKALHDTGGCGVILAGDKTLYNKLDKSIKSRVQAVIEVGSMGFEEVSELLRRRWAWAGGKNSTFPFGFRDLREIYGKSGGNPRRALSVAGNILISKMLGEDYEGFTEEPSTQKSEEVGEVGVKLTPLQREIYRIVLESKSISIEEVARRVGRSVHSVKARAYELEKKGLVKRRGSILSAN